MSIERKVTFHDRVFAQLTVEDLDAFLDKHDKVNRGAWAGYLRSHAASGSPQMKWALANQDIATNPYED